MDGSLFHFFYLIICSSFPHRWRDHTSYKLLILRTYRQFSGFCWLEVLRPGLQGARGCRKKSPTGPRCMFSSSTTIQQVLKFALAQPHPVLSLPRQRPLAMLLVKSFANLGMLVIALQLIHSVGFAMYVVGAGALIVLLLVLLRSLLVVARQILRSQSVANAINCLALVVTQLNTKLN